MTDLPKRGLLSNLTSTPGPEFEASWDSECAHCYNDIFEGDALRMFDGSAMHADCSLEWAQEQRKKPKPTPAMRDLEPPEERRRRRKK